MAEPLTGAARATDGEVAAGRPPAGPLPDVEFQRRHDRHGGALRRALMRVYGARPDFEEVVTRLHALLARRSQARPLELKLLDRAREADADWFLRGDRLGYSTYVPQFAGSLSGVKARIPYLRDLGVTYLHLLPVLKPRAGDSDGGFAVADFEAVDPRLGSMAELDGLARELRRQGVSTCIDLVLNHVADDHAWSKAAKAGDPYYRGFFHILGDAEEVAAYESALEEIFPASAPGNFTLVDDMGGWVWTTFYPYQWDLNYANPEVFLAILDALLGLAAHGVDVFRLDSVAFIWKQKGAGCRNLPQAHALIEALRAAVAIAAPAVILKAEAIFPLAEASAFFGAEDAPEAHLAYNSSLMAASWLSLVEQSADAFSDILKRSSTPLPRARWATYVRCHDDISWGPLLADMAPRDAEPRLRRAARWLHGETAGSWSRGQPFQSDGAALHGTNGALASLCGLTDPAAPASAQPDAVARVLLMLATTFASGGLPILYMGDEVGLTNDRQYLQVPERAYDGRWLHRPAMNWALLEARDGAPNAAQAIFAGVQRLGAAMRAANASGPARVLPSDNPALARLALGGDQIVLNFSSQAQTLVLSEPGLKDRLSGAPMTSSVAVPAYGVLWLAPDGGV